MPARTPALTGALLLLSCGGEEETTVAPPPPPPLEPNELPTAAFTIDVDLGQAPLRVNFDASSSSDPDGTLVSHAWDFGDGDTATGVRVAHTYAEAGVYEIELTVRDDRDGEASATGSVTAFTPPASGPNRIHGTVWQDRNLDEAMDEDERVLEGFAVFLDMDGDGAYDNGEPLTFSAADGKYEFAGLDADRGYTVSQILQFGWSSTFAGPSAPPSGTLPPGTAAIVGGKDADIHDFPFQVALRARSNLAQICGGTLLNSRYVLTAAHCVFGVPANLMEILIGSADLNTGGDVSRSRPSGRTRSSARPSITMSRSCACRAHTCIPGSTSRRRTSRSIPRPATRPPPWAGDRRGPVGMGRTPTYCSARTCPSSATTPAEWWPDFFSAA